MSGFIGPVPRDYRDFTPDPTGEKYGIPTYFWKTAPDHLLTRRQLSSEGLRPGDQDIAAQVVILRRHRDPLVAHLFDVTKAQLKREPTEAQLDSLRVARWVRSADACERHGVDASDMREMIAQARADLAARRQARQSADRDRRRSR